MTSDSIGRYELIEEIGRGGMAKVYRAYDPLFKRDVAIKLMTQDLLDAPNIKARFEREAQTIAALEHPAIVPVHDFGEDEGRPYLVMRLMTGKTLSERLEQGPLSIEDTSAILTRIGSALDRAHHQGIIHRDLKPSNIMFDDYGDAFLADFGIARLTESAVTLTGDSVIGTPAYMSPEQIHSDKAIDGRSDIYALGVICFEMLTGQRPYMDATPTKVMMKHILDPVPNAQDVNPELPSEVNSVIAHSMAKNPDERYRTSQELTDTLRRLAQAGYIVTPGTAEVAAAETAAPEGETQFEDADVTEIETLKQLEVIPPQEKPAVADEDFPETEVAPPSFVEKGLPLVSTAILVEDDGFDTEIAPVDEEIIPETEIAVPSFVSAPAAAKPAQPEKAEGRKRNWFMIGGIGLVVVVVIIAVVGGRIFLFSQNTEDGEEEEPVLTANEQPAAQTTSRPVSTNTKPAEGEMGKVDFAVLPGGYLERALAGDYAGTTVAFDGPFADIDAVLFEESVAPFEEATGIDINYIGDKEFEGRIAIAVEGGNAPDIADFPQPGLLAGFARQGYVVDVSDILPLDWLQRQYNQSWLDMATMEGPNGDDMMAGTWYRMNTKSQVFYPKAQFDAAGYEVPETWDELLVLTQTIADDGDPAWCIGIESGAGTGWPATDWTEEIMLRTAGTATYDDWVAGTLPFDSPEVREAVEIWSQIWFNPDFVFGGTDGIVTTNFGDSPAPMFEDPPKCWLHKQGNFITGFFPEGVNFGEDWDMFYLPGIEAEHGRPYLVAGDLNAMFNDRPEVRAVMEFMTIPESAVGWLQNGGALAAHQTVTSDMYGQEVERKLAEFVAEATDFRFDGSDLMPGEVGAGSFWSGMTDYVSGSADLDTVLSEIDASWPR